MAADVANTQRFLGILARGASDAAMLVIGDSTGNDDWEWVRLTAGALARRFPAYSVRYASWDREAQRYREPVLVRRGGGPHTLHVWNGSAGGRTTRYGLGALFPEMIAATGPDIVFVSHGHNEGVKSGLGTWLRADERRWRGQYAALTETVTSTFPDAALVVVLQNPQHPDVDAGRLQGRRAAVYADLAAQRGFGVVDVHRVFLARPGWETEWMNGPVHPNRAGEAAWAREVARHLVPDPRLTPRAQLPSPLLGKGRQVFSNARFTRFTGTVPTGWTRVRGAVTGKDMSWFETGTHGLTLRGPGDARLTRQLPLSTRNRWVTVAARVRIPGGSPGAAGRIGLGGITGTVVTRGDSDQGQGGFLWVVVSNRVGGATRTPYVSLYGDGLTDGPGVTFDRVSVTVGELPREC